MGHTCILFPIYYQEVNIIYKNEYNFDYIIVSAGPAGCVLARELLEEKNTVLLLEAGDNNDNDI